MAAAANPAPPLKKQRTEQRVPQTRTRSTTATATAMDPSSSQNVLPHELVQQILSFLGRTDLARMASVSRRLNAITLPLLYKSISLSSDNPSVSLTLTLLEQPLKYAAASASKLLGQYVRHATLTTSRTHWLSNEGWISPSVFRHFINLESLKFIGFPYRKMFDKHDFRDILAQSCSSLVGNGTGIEFVPTDDLNPIGAGAWTESDIYPHSPDLNVPTLASSPHTRILSLHFPRLASLELGTLSRTANETLSQEHLTRFLIDHPTIQRLSMGTRRPHSSVGAPGHQQRAPHFQFHRALLTLHRETFLPALTSFQGYPANLSLLISLNVSSVSRIKELSLCALEPENADVTALVGLSVALAGVERLEFDLYREDVRVGLPNVDDGDELDEGAATAGHGYTASLSHFTMANYTEIAHVTSIIELATLCPEVEFVYAHLPAMHATTIARLFSPFTHLTHLTLPHFSLHLHICPGHEVAYFSPLAVRCPKLKTVASRRPSYSMVDEAVYVLRRRAGLGEEELSLALKLERVGVEWRCAS